MAVGGDLVHSALVGNLQSVQHTATIELAVLHEV